jgi:anti-sigma factor RsiW
MSEPDLACAEFVELVTGYLDGALGDADRRRVDEHLELCDGCSTYLEQIRRTVAVAGQLPEPEPLPDEGRARLLEAFRRLTPGA